MILSIVASIRHRLEYSNDYCVEDDDGIYVVVRNYLSTVLADNPLACVNFDLVVDSFVILEAASAKTLNAPAIQIKMLFSF